MKTKELFPAELKCNGLQNPLGVSQDRIALSWEIQGEGKNVIQTEVRLQISRTRDFKEDHVIFYEVYQSADQQIVFEKAKEQLKLEENTTYYWRISLDVDSEAGKARTDFSEAAEFVTAYDTAESWSAKWIEADEAFYEDAEKECRKYWKKKEQLGFLAGMLQDGENGYPNVDQGLRRVPYFEKRFFLSDQIDYARISISARGFYELHINGEKIGPCAIAPDFTPYDKCIYYQTFDLREVLCIGENIIEVILADGWFCGHAQGVMGKNHLYGQRPALIAQMEIRQKNGTTMTVASDESFLCYSGPLVYADLFMGERLDLTQPGKKYASVEKAYDKGVLTPQAGEYIEVTEVLNAVDVKRMEDGSYLVDFGQVIAGHEKIRLSGKKGDLIKIERCEELTQNGKMYNPIPQFPYHDQTNCVIFDERKEYLYCPQFSFQGFRYLCISGLLGELRTEDCKAEVLGTAMKNTSVFSCSNEKINQLISNIKWSQRGNMISIPTDCPQRERGGFTGDAQIFAAASTWNLDVRQFFLRWLVQCRAEQKTGGQIPIVVPYTEAYREAEPNPGWTSAGWGDAIILIPWQLYQIYDEPIFLRDNFAAMVKWMDYVERCAQETMPEKYYTDILNRKRQKYLWNTGFHWGDWLVPGMSSEEGVAKTKEITASLFYFRTVKVMAQVCRVLGRKAEEEHYRWLEKKIQAAFHEEYIKDGHLTSELQGNYVMALAFGMAEGEEIVHFAKRLNELVEENGFCLQTGFLSTPFLLDVLWDHGYQDTALKVLYQEKCPSWLYEVNHGATTIWEEWDGITEDGKLKATSFNHYAFGSVCDFIYRKIGGLTFLENGYRKFQIFPEGNQGISECHLQYHSIYGVIDIRWKKCGDKLCYDIQIPHNTSAVVKGTYESCEVGSGSYRLELR